MHCKMYTNKVSRCEPNDGELSRMIRGTATFLLPQIFLPELIVHARFKCSYINVSQARNVMYTFVLSECQIK